MTVNMATYENLSSNPFLEQALGGCAATQTHHKEAPGMAILQTSQQILVVDQNIQIPSVDRAESDSHVIQNDKQDLHNSDAPESDDQESGLNSIKQSTTLKHENETSTSMNDDIAKACEDLVETTIRLELEDRCQVTLDNSVSLVSSKINPVSTKESQHPKIEQSNSQQDRRIQLEELQEDDDDFDVEPDNDVAPMLEDSKRNQHVELIKKLRLQLRDLEKYAYERGELDQVPSSIVAERQTVILDTLKDRLSLNLATNELEKLNIDDLKKQVDKEINSLIGPYITKEHLLGQLKTQLTDLERYVSHLHGTLGQIHSDKSYLCHMHNCSSRANSLGSIEGLKNLPDSSCNSNSVEQNSLPRTSRLIKALVTQLICSDMKLRKDYKETKISSASQAPQLCQSKSQTSTANHTSCNTQGEDNAAWTLNIYKVILATDSLTNLLNVDKVNQSDSRLVESVVRRQFVPALKDLLNYGLIDPDMMQQTSSYVSFLFDPYYLLSTFTCFPMAQKSKDLQNQEAINRIHVWNVILEYYKNKNESGFKTSSINTLSKSFDLAPSISGPIKITSKQALLIAIDDIIETLANSRPNGPESHFKSFIYVALNRKKLSTWLRLIFRSKSIVRKYYHNFGFASQPDKIDKLLSTIEPLSQFDFKLSTDTESIEQFVSAF